MTQTNKKNSIYLIGPMAQALQVQESIDDDCVELILFVDAGVQIKSQLSYDAPDYSIGDGDGASKSYALDELHPSEKDSSDLSLALQHLNDFRSEGASQLKCFGLWGGRSDHHLANMGEFLKWISDNPSRVILWYSNEREWAYFSSGSSQHFYKGTFSLFLSQSSEVTLKGDIKYSLNQQKLEAFSSHGLSNEAQGKFSVETTSPYMLIFLD